MPIEQANCMRRFVRMCADAWEQGWHESNAGNLSYRLDEEDIRVCMPFFSIKGEGHEWHGLGFADSDLAGQFFMVTAGGSPLRKVGIDPAINCGVVEIDGEGKAWRKVWGLKGTHPTSEFSSHLLAHAVFIRETDGDNRVVYHAHAPNVTALSLLLEPDEAQWNRALWGVMTEVIWLLRASACCLGCCRAARSSRCGRPRSWKRTTPWSGLSMGLSCASRPSTTRSAWRTR